MSDGYLGAGGRLEGGPAPELVAGAYSHEIDAAPRLAPWLSLADLAHAVALAEAGAIPADDARGLLGGLLDLDAAGPGALPWRPELGDAFNSREAALTERVGAGGGRMAQRGAAAARGLPGRPAAVRPRRRPRPARRAARRRRRHDRPRRASRGRPRRRLHLPPARPADHDRPPAAGLRGPGAARRRAPTRGPRPARPRRRRGGRERGLALASRSRPARRPARMLGRRPAHQGRHVAGGRLRRAGRRRGHRGHPRLAARPGPRDPRQPGIRRGGARGPPQPRERAHAAEAQPVRPRRHPHPGRRRGREISPRSW